MSAAPDPPRGGRPAAPGLTLVSVPIGDARDVTLRALDVLATAEVLAAEDTRSLRRLMEIHGLAIGDRPLLSYHDHNGPAMRPRLLAAMAEGRSVAYASEAGTPLVADPGFALARAAIGAGHPVTAAPGPSALLGALALGGLPTDRFLFAGFPPPAAGPRRRWIEGLDAAGATVAIYESPRRVHRLLREMAEAMGPERPAALARELTKRFEEVSRGTLATLAEGLEGRTPRGEFVVLVGRAEPEAAGEESVAAALREALDRSSRRDAVAEVARATGRPRREVYALALRMGDEDGGASQDG
jgi:16S rRNA (cytidine1402-2'-O)-methyltransferase